MMMMMMMMMNLKWIYKDSVSWTAREVLIAVPQKVED